MPSAPVHPSTPLPDAASPGGVFADECDLVMKGGITSGIVYPLAIHEIHRAFRLRSIGGTSAGAIAAAAAAAAEAGRQRRATGVLAADSACRDFAELPDLPGYLGQPAACGASTRLLALFRPHPALASLFNGLTAALGAAGRAARVRAMARSLLGYFKWPLLTGFTLGALPLAFIELGTLQPLTLLWLLAAGLLSGVLLSLGWFAVRLVRVLRSQRFGLCSGMPNPGDSEEVGAECLTVWIHRYLDRLCGQAEVFQTSASGQARKPLTFGDLKDCGIDLQMMTTCLSQGRPYRLPFRDEVQVRDNTQFYFQEHEFRELFPREVVDWMVAHPRAARGGAHASTLRQDYCRLPEPEDLPVVVAVRMSLSFPLLLSAIPLYAIDYERPGKQLEACWFSDGGLSSNFPIHFFDSPLPQRPTFGLDLGRTDQADSPRVVFPKDNGQARMPTWRRFEQASGLGSILGFLSTVLSTSKEWNHDTLSRLPGFRDRIGLIRLTEEEGGLNLAMPAQRIAALTEYGRQAGIEFVLRFGDSERVLQRPGNRHMNWENHQLIRLRLLIASVSEMLGNLQTSHERLDANPVQRYQRFFGPVPLGPSAYRLQHRGVAQVPGQRYQSQARLAEHVLNTLLGLAADIDAATKGPRGRTVDPRHKAPKPTPELKPRPRI